jgi:hypothetical protein
METKLGLDTFVQVLGELLLARHCDDQLAQHLASFFWERLSEDYKERWKRKSKQLQYEKGKKVPGFWMFAKKVIKALYEKDISFFEYIWKWIQH